MTQDTQATTDTPESVAETRDTLTPEPALFIPLKTEHFEAFAAGTKPEEFRPYGARWNERTCRVGRRVTVSHGYGKQRRLHGVVTGFRIVGPDAHPALPTLYQGKDQFAAIAIRFDGYSQEPADAIRARSTSTEGRHG